MIFLMCVSVTGTCMAGALTGKITDIENNSIPGVTVTVNNPRLARSFTDTTSMKGRYRFQDLPAGVYVLRAELMGMKTLELNGRLRGNKLHRST